MRERARRAARIVAARHSGGTWQQIAAEFEISVSQAKAIVADWQDSGPGDVDELDSFSALLGVLRQAVSDYALIVQCATHDSNRIGALKGLVETASLRWDVERSAGLVPSHPAAPKLAHQLQQVFHELEDLLRRHDVSDEALKEIVELAQRTAMHPPGGARLVLTTGGQVR